MHTPSKTDNSIKKSQYTAAINSSSSNLVTSTVPSLTMLNQSLTDSLSSRSALDYHDVPNEFGKMKKSYFQITKITNRKEDTQEDFDEATNTEDLSFDVSRTDLEHEPSSTSTVHSPGGVVDDLVWPNISNYNNIIVSSSVVTNNNSSSNNLIGLQKTASSMRNNKKNPVSHSRFKIVKLESEDWLKRGRWTCMTFSDPPVDIFKAQKSTSTMYDNSRDSIYYIPSFPDDQTCPVMFTPIVYNEGHPSLKANHQASVPSYYFVTNDNPNRTTAVLNTVQLMPQNDSTDQFLLQTSSQQLPSNQTEPSSQPSTLPQMAPNFLLTTPTNPGKILNKRTTLNQNPLFAMVTATMSSSSFSDNEEGWVFCNNYKYFKFLFDQFNSLLKIVILNIKRILLKF